MARTLLSLPRWAQEQFKGVQWAKERAERDVTRHLATIEKQSGEVQALLDIVRAIRPDLFDLWNNGTSLDDLVTTARKSTGADIRERTDAASSDGVC